MHTPEMVAAWLVIAALLGVTEALTMDLTFIMLAGGALVGAGAAAFGAGVALSVGLAGLSAMGLLVFARPVARRHLEQATPRMLSGTQALVGGEATALTVIDRNGGRAKISGEEWSARTLDTDAVIQPGTVVVVAQIDGATAVVFQL